MFALALECKHWLRVPSTKKISTPRWCADFFGEGQEFNTKCTRYHCSRLFRLLCAHGYLRIDRIRVPIFFFIKAIDNNGYNSI